MPNFRDPKTALLSLLIAVLTAVIWATPPTANADEVAQVGSLGLANPSPRVHSPQWLTPKSAEMELLRPFLRPTSDWGAGHRGVDFAVTSQEQLRAPHESTITFANQAFGVPTVVLSHSDGTSQVFQPACLLEDSEVGQTLAAGQSFGAFCGMDGHDGHCAQLACIHWSYRLDKSTYINPLRMIGYLAPATLLPLGQVDTASAT